MTLIKCVEHFTSKAIVAPGTRVPPPYILEVQKRRVADVLADYPNFNPKLKDGRHDVDLAREVEWFEYWDAENYIIEVDDQRLIDKPNPYGFIPYTFRYAGLGRTSSDGDPASLSVGILNVIEGELMEEVRLKTAESASWQYHAFPILLTKQHPQAVQKQLMAGPGVILRVTEDMSQSPKWLEVPPPPREMHEFLQIVQENIYRKVSPALLERPSGVDAGIHQALLVGQALKVITPVKNALDALATELLNIMARQCYIFELDQTVVGTLDKVEKEHELPWKEFRHFAFKVVFEATDPAENDRRMLLGLSILRVPGLMSRESWRDVFAKAVIPNPEEEEVKILTEQIIDQYLASGLFLQAVQEEQLAQEQAAGQQGLQSALTHQIRGVAGAVEGVTNRGSMLESAAGLPTGAAQAGRSSVQSGMQAGGV